MRLRTRRVAGQLEGEMHRGDPVVDHVVGAVEEQYLKRMEEQCLILAREGAEAG